MKPLQTRPSAHPDGTGRPSKLTEAVHKAIVEGLRRGNYLTTVAASQGLNPQSVRLWIRRGSDPNYAPKGAEFDEDGFSTDFYGRFARDVAIAQAYAEMAAVGALQDHFERDWRAAAEYLQRKFPDRWNPKMVMELSGKDGGAIEVTESKKAFMSKIDVLNVERDDEIEDAEIIEEEQRELEAGEDSTSEEHEQLELFPA